MYREVLRREQAVQIYCVDTSLLGAGLFGARDSSGLSSGLNCNGDRMYVVILFLWDMSIGGWTVYTEGQSVIRYQCRQCWCIICSAWEVGIASWRNLDLASWVLWKSNKYITTSNSPEGSNKLNTSRYSSLNFRVSLELNSIYIKFNSKKVKLILLQLFYLVQDSVL